MIYRPFYRQWRHLLLSLVFLCFQSSLDSVHAAKKDLKLYLYHDLPEGEEAADPIIEYTDDPEDRDQMPPFLDTQIDHHRAVLFYSPVCPHCIHFAPIYIAFARHFNELTHGDTTLYAGVRVKFYAVSCTKYKKVCRHEKANSYPTLRIYAANQSKGPILHQAELTPLSILKKLGIGYVKDEWEGNGTIMGKSEKMAVETEPPKPVQFMPRTRSQVYADAYLSFHHTLKNSIFLEDNKPLPQRRGEAIKMWLHLLNKVLPPWRRMDLVIAELLDDFQNNAAAEKQWNSILDTYPPKHEDYSPACQQHDSPYTCGLWTLFHIMTVGVVEYNSALSPKDTKHQGTPAVAGFLREYVHRFFLCEECSTHFVQAYDACEYNRCTRLTNISRNLEEWRELPLWLLEFHNGVNLRLQREEFEREGRTEAPTVEDEQRVMWPPVEACPICWTSVAGAESDYDAEVLYDYMRGIYWPKDGRTSSFQRLLQDSIAEYEQNPILVSKSSRRTTQKFEIASMTDDEIKVDAPYLLVTIAVCGLWLVVLWRKFQMDRVLGIHRTKLRTV